MKPFQPETDQIVVFGANGYIGRHICAKLKMLHFQFIPSDRHEFSIDSYSNYVSLDLKDRNSLNNQFQTARFFIFLTGKTGTLDSFNQYENYISSNQLTLLHFLDSIKSRANDVKVLFPSSRLVYKGTFGGTLKESDEKELKTIYAINKFACEEYLKAYHNLFQLNYLILRICVPYGNLIGPEQSYGTFSALLKCATKGENISIFGQGEQRRSVIHIDDLSSLMIESLIHFKCVNEIFNAGGNEDFSIQEIAQKITKKYNVHAQFKEWPIEHYKIESWDTTFDSSKLERILNFNYKNRFDEWLETL